jgi:3-dehydroquinate synthase
MLHAISFILMLLHSTSFRLHSDFLRNYHAKHQRLYLEVVKVELGDRSYPIYIGNELLKTGEVFMDHVRNKKILIVTNTVVAPLYLSAVKDSLKSNGIEVFEVILPDGEEFKTINVLMKIIDVAIDSKLDRQSVFIALGGLISSL